MMVLGLEKVHLPTKFVISNNLLPPKEIDSWPIPETYNQYFKQYLELYDKY